MPVTSRLNQGVGTSVSSDEIEDGTIVNADINASAAIDATKIHDGSISNTEFGYLNSATSNIQTQLDGKSSLSRKPGDMQNVGISVADDVVTIHQADGSAFADTAGNRGYIWTRSSTNGQVIRAELIANVTISADGPHWALDTRGDIAGGILRVLMVNNLATTDDFTPVFGLAYQGGRMTIADTLTSTTASDINLPDEVLVNSALSSGTSTVVEIGYVIGDFDDTGGTSENLWSFTSAIVGESADGVWQPWRPGYVGFSSDPGTPDFSKWMSVGGTVTLSRERSGSAGTSNSTAFQMTAPIYAEASQIGMIYDGIDNGGSLSPSGLITTTANSPTLVLFTGSAGGNWTAANGKDASLYIQYEANK